MEPVAAEESADSEPRRNNDRLLAIAMVAFGFSGAAALIYELTWTRQLSLVFSSTVYSMSLMLAAFMAGLSLGGKLGGDWADHRQIWFVKSHDTSARALARDLAIIELGISVCGLVSLVGIRMTPHLQYFVLKELRPSPSAFFVFQMVLAFLLMLLPTTMMGATLPLMSKMAVNSYGKLGRTVGRLYSSNNLGAVAGSLLGGFVLIPLIGVRHTVVVAAALNGTVAIVLLWASGRRRQEAVVVTVLVLALAMSASAWREPPLTLGFGIDGRYASYQDYLNDVRHLKTLYEKQNEYSRVAVIEDQQGVRALVNGPLVEGSDDAPDLVNTYMLGILPSAFSAAPVSALSIGLGTGLTSESLLYLPFKSVTTIEINPAVNEAARSFIGDEVFSDPRFNLVNTDARSFLQMSEKNYDVITSEPSWPIAASVSPLFTSEFFEIGKSKLTAGGVFCQWVPKYMVSSKDFSIVYRTFNKTFPGAQLWSFDIYGDRQEDLLMIGVKGGEYPSKSVVLNRMKGPLKQPSLEGVTLVRIDPQTVAADVYDKRGAINTDDLPLLEFHAPLALVKSTEDSIHSN